MDILCHWCQRGINENKGRYEDKLKIKTKGEHAHRGVMSFCHQWQRGRLLMKLSLMPTWTCSGPIGCHWCHHLAEDVEDPADDAKDPEDGPEALMDVGEALTWWFDGPCIFEGSWGLRTLGDVPRTWGRLGTYLYSGVMTLEHLLACYGTLACSWWWPSPPWRWYQLIWRSPRKDT